MDHRPFGSDPLRLYGEVLETTLLIADIVAVSLLAMTVLANTAVGQAWLSTLGHALSLPGDTGSRPLSPTMRAWIQAMGYGMGGCC